MARSFPQPEERRSGAICGFSGVVIDRVLHITSERVVAISRALLAAGGLVAIYLDPTQPSQGEIGYLFVAAYLVFALALLAIADRPLRGRTAVTAHAFEIALICLIISYTEGPSSPFFVYFTFVLLVSALRWQQRGALITGALLTIVLVALTASELLVSHSQPLDIDRLVLRNIYLLVASVLIALFGDELGRSHQRSARLRLARELHDGILQALTAARLKLRGAAATATGAQRQKLVDITNLLDEEQRRVRLFVDASRNEDQVGRDSPQTKSAVSDLKALATHLEKLWNCAIELRMPERKAEIPSVLHPPLNAIIAESVANAVMHGRAKKIAVTVGKTGGSLSLTIKDDGKGLPKRRGRFAHDRLVAENIGPNSLRARVTELGGQICLATSQRGVELQIELPISRVA